MFQDEARFGRINDVRRCWAPKPVRPLCQAMLTHEYTYAPELNPVEHVWDELREKYFHNRVFDSLDALEDQLEMALRIFESNAPMVKSIVAWKWIVIALLN